MSAAMSHEAVGLIGVGLLGTALAERLLQSGFAVHGFDLEATQRRRLQELGGTAADSAAAVAAACRRLILSLPDSAAVTDVVAQIEDQLAPGAVILDTTTGDPQTSVAVGQRLAARGVGYLDATIAGSSAQARQADVVVMIGGPEQDVQACQDLLQVLARRVFHVGPGGSGAQMKLITNLVLGLNRAVLAEGLALARACGIDPALALEVLRSGAAYSAAMDAKGAKMVAQDFAPQARLAQHHKDVGLILQLADRAGMRLPLSTAHEQLLAEACRRGYGQADNSAIIKAYV